MQIGVIFSSSSNIGNIQKAILYLGHEPVLVSEKTAIPKLSHLVIPGVGSFPKMMTFLKDNELDTSIIDGAKNDLKILGICLGMHLLFERSDEFGTTKGLSLLKGTVKKIRVTNNKKRIMQIKQPIEGGKTPYRQPCVSTIHAINGIRTS